ncbi:MAG: hypothetical protein ACJ790_03905 [Myxococcaceae bacterium]
MPRSTSLNCPQCGAKVADGEAICPKCDFIIDASFLSGESPTGDVGDQATNVGKPVQKPVSGSTKVPGGKPATGQRPAMKPATGQRPAMAAAGAAAKPKTGTRPAMKPQTGVRKAMPLTSRPEKMPEPDADASTNVLPPKREGGPPPPDTKPGGASPTGPAIPRTSSGMQMVAPEQALDDFKSFVSNLPSGDKIAFIGAAAFIFTCFLPWKETAADGEILGLMSLGIIDFLVMIAVIGSLVIRVRRVMPQLNPLVPWLVQLGGAGFSIVWCLVYIGISTDLRKTQALVGNFEQSVSAPAFGVWLAILCGAATVAGTLMGLKSKPA